MRPFVAESPIRVGLAGAENNRRVSVDRTVHSGSFAPRGGPALRVASTPGQGGAGSRDDLNEPNAAPPRIRCAPDPGRRGVMVIAEAFQLAPACPGVEVIWVVISITVPSLYRNARPVDPPRRHAQVAQQPVGRPAPQSIEESGVGTPKMKITQVARVFYPPRVHAATGCSPQRHRKYFGHFQQVERREHRQE